MSDAEDITDLYKYKEGTEEERMAVLNAARGEYCCFRSFSPYHSPPAGG